MSKVKNILKNKIFQSCVLIRVEIIKWTLDKVSRRESRISNIIDRFIDIRFNIVFELGIFDSRSWETKGIKKKNIYYHR